MSRWLLMYTPVPRDECAEDLAGGQRSGPWLESSKLRLRADEYTDAAAGRIFPFEHNTKDQQLHSPAACKRTCSTTLCPS